MTIETENTAQPTGTEAEVCKMIAERQRLGIAKYGQTVADNPLSLRAWLQHALEETLDQAVYLKRAIEEIDAATPMRVCSENRSEGFVKLKEMCHNGLGSMGLEPGDQVLIMSIPKP